MALKILKEVSAKGDLKTDGCYIQVKPYLPFDLQNVPVDRGIWKSKEDFEANQSGPTIPALIEIKNAYYLNPEDAGDIYEGKNILYKMLWWVNTAIKQQILADNPTWVDADIEIVDIPKL